VRGHAKGGAAPPARGASRTAGQSCELRRWRAAPSTACGAWPIPFCSSLRPNWSLTRSGRSSDCRKPARVSCSKRPFSASR
jgi:hypothetical protein